MPRGYPTPKTAPAPAAEAQPAPMIFIEPGPDGAIRFNAYGLDAGQIIGTLRRTLLHLVATQSGVQVISLDVPPHALVLPALTRSAKPKPAKPSRNGSKATTRDLEPSAAWAHDVFDDDNQ